MTKRELAQSLIDEAKEGIAWFAVWKVGRTWAYWVSFDFDYDGEGRLTIEEDYKENLALMKSILEDDRNAVFLNGYYTNLGFAEDMTIASLADALEWQYKMCGNRLLEAIESVEYWHERKEDWK